MAKMMQSNDGDTASRVRGGRPHTLSMADVAAVAGVSQQTVSRVINNLPNVSEKTRERVNKAVAELGFRPNYAGRSLRVGRYRSVGLCVNDVTQIGNLSLLDGISAAARARGYAITLIEMSKTESFSLAEASRRMAELPVDGMVIAMSRMAPDFESFTPQARMGTVLVSMYAHPRCTTVDSDHYGCSTLVMEHLFNYGHEQIRYVAGPSFSIDNEFREAGWRDALVARGIEPVEPLRGDWSANSGYEAGLKLADDRSMTAVYAANDQMAIGVIDALRDRGLRVPEDVSVVGIDDSLGSYCAHNNLTTVRFDLLSRGATVFEHAVPSEEEDQNGIGSWNSDGTTAAGTDVKTIRIPGRLVERGTVVERR